jgi:hypothetical protein
VPHHDFFTEGFQRHLVDQRHLLGAISEKTPTLKFPTKIGAAPR